MPLEMASSSGNASGSIWQACLNVVHSDSTVLAVPAAYASWASIAAGQFTPVAGDYDGVAIRLGIRSSTSGTFSIRLETSGGAIAGTEVTINMADFPSANSTDSNGGWHFFKFAATVTLAAVATAVNVKTSSASLLSIFSSAASSYNFARFLRSTTVGTLAAGDDFVVVREHTGAGTSNSISVTWDITATTDFGGAVSAANAAIQPAGHVGDGGTLAFAAAGSTNYHMRLSGNLQVYSGGLVTVGTSDTPIPSGSTATIQFDPVANVDYGIQVRNNSTFRAYGTKAFTPSPCNHFTILTADEAAGQTVIGPLLDTTGWAAGDQIALSVTTRTNTEVELATILTVDSPTQITISAGLSFAHSGTNDANGDIRCRVENLTRNVVIRGASTTLGAFINVQSGATLDCDRTTLQYMGSTTTSKRGIDCLTNTGSVTLNLCVFREWEQGQSLIRNAMTLAGGTFTVDKCIWYRTGGALSLPAATTNTTWAVRDCHVLRTLSSGVTVFEFSDVGGTITNNFINGVVGLGISVIESNVIGTFAGNYVSATSNARGISITNAISGTISNCQVSRCSEGSPGSGAFSYVPTGGQGTNGPLVIDGLVAFGNTNHNVVISNGHSIFRNCSIQGGATLQCLRGIRFVASGNETTTGTGAVFAEFENCQLFNVTTTSNPWLTVGGSAANQFMYPVQAIFSDCDFGTPVSGTLVENVSTMLAEHYDHFFLFLKYNGVKGDNRAFFGHGATGGTTGNVFPDTTFFSGSSPGLRMLPGQSARRMKSPLFSASVADGNTLTVSVKVRQSVAGDGTAHSGYTTRPRLMVRKNYALGITEDTVLNTATAAADGAFETLTGTTAAVTDNGTLEFFVDVEGTAGWITLDDWECVAADPNGLAYWSQINGGPWGAGRPAGGGGGMIGGGNLRGGFQ